MIWYSSANKTVIRESDPDELSLYAPIGAVLGNCDMMHLTIPRHCGMMITLTL